MQIGFNDGANRGFWRIQPRDDEGQWIEMGGTVLFRYRDGAGRLLVIAELGIYVGPTGKPGKARVLVKEGNKAGLKPGVYELDSNNLTQIKALLPEEALKSLPKLQRKDKFGKAVKTLEDAKLPTREQLEATRTDATPDDERIANGDVPQEVKDAERDGRENSPIANLPAGFEAESPEEVRKLLKDSGVDTAEFESEPKQEGPKEGDFEAGFLPFGGGPRQPARIYENGKWRPATPEEERIRGLVKGTDENLSPTKEGDYRPEHDTENKKLSAGYVYKNGEWVKATREEMLSNNQKPKGQETAVSEITDVRKLKEGMVVKNPDGSTKTVTKVTRTKRSSPSDRAGRGDATSEDYEIEYSDGSTDSERTSNGRIFGNPQLREVVDKNSKKSEEKPSTRIKADDSDGGDDFEDINFDDIDFDEPEAKPEPKPEAKAKPEPKPKAKKEQKPTAVEPKPEVAQETVQEEVPIVEPDPNLNEMEKRQPTEEEAEEIDNQISEMSSDRKELDYSFDPEIEKLGSPEEYVEDFGFMPSTEQTYAVNAIAKARKRTVINALAGAGKTSTLVAAARALKRLSKKSRVLSLQFNNKNAKEAQARMPDNTLALTTHSLARRSLTGPQAAATKGGPAFVVGDAAVAKYFNYDELPVFGDNYNPTKVAAVVRKIVSNFTNTADREIGEKHVLKTLRSLIPSDKKEEYKDKEIDYDPRLLKYAKEYWEDINRTDALQLTEKDGKKFYSPAQRLKIGHDHYLKLWALSNPDLSQLVVNGEKVDVVFFDEAQDTNAAVADVIKKQKNLQVVHVGDPNQAIYEWRGAINAMDNAAKEAEVVSYISETRRFNQELAGPGNAVLNLLGADTRIVGKGTDGALVPREEINLSPEEQTIIIVRSNAGGLGEIRDLINQEKTAGVLQVFKDDLEGNIYTLDWLLNWQNPDRPKRPQNENGEDVSSPDFEGIKNIKELMDLKENDPENKAVKFLTTVETVAGLRGDIESGIKIFKEQILPKLVVVREDGDEEVDTEFSGESGTSGVVFRGKSKYGPVELSYSISSNGELILSGNGLWGKTGKDRTLNDDLKEKFGIRASKNKTTEVWEAKKTLSVEEAKEVLEFINDKSAAQEEKPKIDAIVSTSHRMKGLEADNIIIGSDFKIETDKETGELKIPGPQELRTLYVALTRAKKKMSLGSLDWVMDYEGEEGLEKANKKLNRDPSSVQNPWRRLGIEQSPQAGFDDEEPEDYDFSDDDDTDLDLDEDFEDNVFVRELSRPINTTQRVLAQDFFGDDEEYFRDPQSGNAVKVTQVESDEDNIFIYGVDENGDDYEGSFPRSKSLTRIFFEGDSIPERQEERPRPKPEKKPEPTPEPEPEPELEPEETTEPEVAPLSKKAEDLQVGDTIYKNDEKLGKIVAIKPVDGGVGVIYEDDEGNRKPTKYRNGTDIQTNLEEATEPETTQEPEEIEELAPEPEEITDLGDSTVDETELKVIEELETIPDPVPVVDNPEELVDSRNFEFDPARADGGQDVGRNKADFQSVLRKLKASSSPKEVKQALLEYYRDAVVANDGSVVVYRQTKEEEYGPAAGQIRSLEVRVQETLDNRFLVITKVTDPETGESKEYIHYNPRNSFASIVGEGTGKNRGVEHLLDRYLDRDLETYPFEAENAANPDKAARLYGGIEGGISALRKGNVDRIIDGADDTTLKLRTLEEHAAIILHGRDQTLNTTARNWQWSRRGALPSIYDAWEKNDKEGTALIFSHLANSVPNTPEARDAVFKYLEESLKAKFPKGGKRELNQILKQIKSRLESGSPNYETPQLTHLDRDGNQVTPGSKVAWTNNVGETVIGVVQRLLKINNPDRRGGKFVYDDYAIVEFDGKPDGVRLNTNNMVLTGGAMTKYARWVREKDLMIERAPIRGWRYDPDTDTIVDGKGNLVTNFRDVYGLTGEDEEPELIDTRFWGEDDEDEGDQEGDGGVSPEPEPGPGPAPEPEPEPTPEPESKDDSLLSTSKNSELQSGQTLYDKDGDALGQIISVKTGVVTKGKFAGSKATTVEYKKPDGSTGRVIRRADDAPFGPKKEQGAKTSVSSLKNKAKAVKQKFKESSYEDLTETPSSSDTLLKKPAFSTRERASSKGQFGRSAASAVKPTTKAKELKNELVSVGEQALRRADEIYAEKKKQIIESMTEEKENDLKNNFEQYKAADKAKEAAISELYSEKYRAGDQPKFYSIKTGDAVEWDYVRESISYRGEAGTGHLESMKQVKSILKENGISISYLKKAKIKETTLTRLLTSDSTKEKRNIAINDLKEVEKAIRNFEALDKPGASDSPEYAAKVALRVAQRDSIKEALEEAGVEFDNISLEKFSRFIYPDQYGSRNIQDRQISKKKGETYQALDEAMKFIPRAVLENLIKSLEDEDSYVQFKAGAKRGHFRERIYDKSLGKSIKEITLSPDSRSLGSQGQYTDTALHELFHLIETKNRSLAALQHAWLYDRAVKFNDDGEEYIPARYSIKGSEKSIPVDGIASTYTSKTYPSETTSDDLSPVMRNFEVLTTGVQMFTSPGTYDEFSSKKLVVKEGNKITYFENGVKAYFNSADGKWYKDSAFSIPIAERSIISVIGGEGRDDQFRSFIMGTLIGLS